MFSDLSFGANYLGNLRSVGVKFASIRNKASLNLHINYQQYFYGDASAISSDDNNRLVAMVVLHF